MKQNNPKNEFIDEMNKEIHDEFIFTEYGDINQIIHLGTSIGKDFELKIQYSTSGFYRENLSIWEFLDYNYQSALLEKPNIVRLDRSI